MYTKFIVYLYGCRSTKCFLHTDGVYMYKNYLKLLLNKSNTIDYKPNDSEQFRLLKKCHSFNASARCLKHFMYELYTLPHFRFIIIKAIKNILDVNSCEVLRISFNTPATEVIDYGWNWRMSTLVWGRIEMEHAFSWLSTLGGAFSALGDYFAHCAEMASKISVQQLKLSQMLGDDSLVARSHLYFALALVQKGDLKSAKMVVRRVANFGKKTHDRRLYRMCQGVWAKLRYIYSIRNNPNQSYAKGDAQYFNGGYQSVIC